LDIHVDIHMDNRWVSTWIFSWISVKLRYIHTKQIPGYAQWTLRLARNTDIQEDIREDIGATDIGAQFTIGIRGCSDNSIRTSVILWITKRTIWPGCHRPSTKIVYDSTKSSVKMSRRRIVPIPAAKDHKLGEYEKHRIETYEKSREQKRKKFQVRSPRGVLSCWNCDSGRRE